MPEPSLIECYLDGMRRQLKVNPAEAERILDEAADHLTQSVLHGVESGLSLREAEELAITRFGLPREVCAGFREVYRPWYRRPLDVVGAAALGGLVLGSFPLAAGRIGAEVPLVASLIPILLGFLPAFFRRSIRAGLVPGLAAGAVSVSLWAWCALVSPGWYSDPGQRPPLDVIGIEVFTDLLLMAALMLPVVAGAALGARLRRPGARLA